jgi:DNA-binding LacI/PurR family transcriptional regulator
MAREVKTLADIAAIAGVSPATVSRALAGNMRISEKTRRAVSEIAGAHGFQLNQTARNLRLGVTHSVGVVIPLGHQSAQRVSDPFYTALIGNLMDGLVQHKHDMHLSAVTPDDTSWLKNIAHSGRVDGIIVLCQSDQEAVLREMAEHYLPLVVWGEWQKDVPYCCVGTDNCGGGYAATRHLLAAGRRNIAYAGMMDIPELSARHRGYLKAHAEAGVEPGPQIPVPLAFDPDDPAMHHMMTSHRAIDGVVAASDVIAIAVIRALHGSGRRVPEDVPVIGYDDVSLAAHTLPALTTIRQNMKVAAETMLDLLFRRMQGEATASVHIPFELVRRQSA